jgi:hypothetical protein
VCVLSVILHAGGISRTLNLFLQLLRLVEFIYTISHPRTSWCIICSTSSNKSYIICTEVYISVLKLLVARAMAHLGMSSDTHIRMICWRCESIKRYFLIWIVSSDRSATNSYRINSASSRRVFLFWCDYLCESKEPSAGRSNQHEISTLTT